MVWEVPAMTQKKSITMGSMIRAIDHVDGNLLVGTRDGNIQIVGMESEEKKVIMSSHNDGEVWGLADKDETCIVTSGDDNQVKVWDIEKRTCATTYAVSSRSANPKHKASSTTNLPASKCARAVIMGPAGETIVAANDGVVHVHKADGTSQKLEDAKAWIEVMSVAPNGKFLAVGSHDTKIRIYNTESWAMCGEANKHSSAIQTMDWCVESKWLRSTCQAYELLFWNMGEDGSITQDPSGRSNTIPVMWATKTVKFSWHVDGIFPRGTDGSHINKVAGNAGGDLIATGDDWYHMRVFRDPVRKGSRARTFAGHASFCTGVLFKGDRLFSIGGGDQTVFQWKQC